jgi:hypothetical protein
MKGSYLSYFIVRLDVSIQLSHQTLIGYRDSTVENVLAGVGS